MTAAHRLWTTGTLIVCLLGPQATAFASENDLDAAPVVVDASTVDVSFVRTAMDLPPTPIGDAIHDASPLLASTTVDVWSHALATDSTVLEQRGYGGGRRGGRGGRAVGRAGAALIAMTVGAAASITGGALLVYANRPECRGRSYLNGCGYGFKVVGGAVLTAGFVGMVAGALSFK